MAAPFVVACSHCESKLKLKDPALAGKKIRCPKCGEPFVVRGKKAGAKARTKKPSNSEDEFGFLGNISEEHYEAPEGTEGEEDDWGELPQSPLAKRKAAAGSKGKKKRKRASSGPGFGRVAMIAGLILVGLATAGGVGYAVYSIVSGLGGGASRFAWLPDDSEMVVEVHVADLWNAQALKPLTSSDVATQMQEKLKSEHNVSITDIDRVVIGSRFDSQQPVVVTYLHKPIDMADVEADSTKSEHGGWTLYTSKTGQGTAFFPDATTMVIGQEAQLKGVIDRQGESAVASKFADLPTSGHIVVGTLKPANAKAMQGNLPGSEAIDLENVESFSVVVNCTSDIDVALAFVCRDSASAESLVGQMEKDRADGLSQLQQQKAAMASNPLAGLMGGNSMLDSFESVLESYQIKASGTTVTGNLRVPGKVIKGLSDMIGMMMPAMMRELGPGGGMGGPGQFGGPPSGAPPGFDSEGFGSESNGPGEHGESP